MRGNFIHRVYLPAAFGALALVGVMTSAGLVAAADVKAPAVPQGSLDEQLRRQLDARLLDDLGGLAPAPSNDPKPEKPSPKGEGDPAKSAPHKEAEAEAESTDPWERVGKSMRQAGRLLEEKNTAEKTQSLQRAVVGDLARLIEQLQKQAACQGGKCASPKSGSPAAQTSRKPGGSSGQSDDGPSATPGPAKESVVRSGQGDTQGATASVVDGIRRAAWGNLPERVRSQLQNSAGEEFLPEYSEMIEEYFRRLAEAPPR